MAFVSRQRRDFHPGGTIPTDVGPGQYDLIRPPKSRAGLAPFSTSQDRGVLSIQYKFQPGPGEYNEPSPTRGRIMGAGAAFKSRSHRTDMLRRTHAPGPAHYSVSAGSWTHLPKNHSAAFGGGLNDPAYSAGGVANKDSQIAWVRLPTAPSIPARQQRYGFKRDKGGEWVMKSGPIRPFTGKPEDCVGPMDYNPPVEPFKDTKVIKPFAASKTKRGLPWKESNTPGPGKYVTQWDDNAIAPGTSALLSGTNRFPSASTPGPGPACYDKVKASSILLNQKQAVFSESHFGGTAARKSFWQDEIRKMVPGPGHYTSSSARKQRRSGGVPRISRSSPAPFSSTVGRFHTASKTSSVAPGKHQKDRVSTELTKESYGRNASFGTTATRFGPRKSNGRDRTIRPGPGSYDPPREKPIASQRVSFGSAVKRFQPSKSETPSPGEFHRRAKWRKGGASAGFKSGVARLPDAPNINNPGPGDYNAGKSSVAKPKRPARTATPSFGSGSLRFEPGKKLTPGPGDYTHPISMLPKRFSARQ